MAWPVSTRATNDLITAAIWNADLVANMNTVARPIPKTADESLAANTTLQNDDHLFFAMAANEYYSIRGTLWHSNAADAGHLKIAFTVPASATYHVASEGVGAGGSSYDHNDHRNVAATASYFSPATGAVCHFRGIVANAGTAGNFQVQWAQNTVNGTATFIKKGSHLIISKLG